MSDVTHYIGQRLSLNSQTCTVQYIGSVKNKNGIWLGVEWDDPRRGKHDGSFEGEQYFSCKSGHATAGSFLRAAQQWNPSRTFLQALTDKYLRIEDATAVDTLYVSRSKQFEEVGFEKLAKRQAELRGIQVIVLDHMQIDGRLTTGDASSISTLCAHITDLDIGGNLFEHVEDVWKICTLLPNLRRLTLDGNRFTDFRPATHTFPGVQSLSLNGTLLGDNELSNVLSSFPRLVSLDYAHSNVKHWRIRDIPASIATIDLSSNLITSFDQLIGIPQLPNLKTLKLKDNLISKSTSEPAIPVVSTTITDLDLGFNEIASWDIISSLPIAFPALRSLRVSGNPLYASLRSANNKPMTAEDGYMLTVARLSHVHTLNFSAIRDKDRLNAEKYYLGEVAAEIAAVSPELENSILKRHPRWTDLCEEYGTPEIKRSPDSKVNPASLAARLVTINIYDNHNNVCTMEVPRAYSIYALYGLAGKSLGIPPHTFKLVWETGEQDPVSLKDDCAVPID